MCNLYRLHKGPDAIRALFANLDLQLGFPEGVPNLQPRDIRITEAAPIVRQAAEGGLELIMRRWSWPAAGGKPVYNFRSDNRQFPSGRCLVLADGFYEFTAPADPKQKRKDRWLFTLPDEGLLGIAGLVRDAPGIGEAFTLLTAPPGPDVAPYHDRQVALLKPADWLTWLDHSAPSIDLIGPAPPGTVNVRAAMT